VVDGYSVLTVLLYKNILIYYMSDLCEEIRKLGKGIGSENRYRILVELFKGPRTVGIIVQKVQLSQPAVSQHLETLNSCGLIERQKKGQRVYYSVNVKHTLGVLRHLIETLNRCPQTSAKIKNELQKRH